MTPTVYFLHGRDSSPLSTKIQYLGSIAKSLGWNVVAPDLTCTKDPDQRVSIFLQNIENVPVKNVIVGSSMGGYVALMASAVVKPAALLLLAPALNLEGYCESDPLPFAGETSIIHGWMDEVIAAQSVFNYAMAHRVRLHMVADQHDLHKSLSYIGEVFRSILVHSATIPRQKRVIASI